MKKYIRASRRKNDADNYIAWAKAIRRDIRNVAACKSQEDLDNLEIQSSNSNYIKKIWDERCEKMGITDFDDKIDAIVDWLYDTLNVTKDFNERYSQELIVADENHNKIKNYLQELDNHEFIEGFEEQDSDFLVNPEDMSRNALIEFIDDLIAKFGGRYFGTGRGGSWTSWNIKIDGIEYQIGPTDDGSAWLIHEV